MITVNKPAVVVEQSPTARLGFINPSIYCGLDINRYLGTPYIRNLATQSTGSSLK